MSNKELPKFYDAVGQYDIYPNLSEERIAEGGKRLRSQPQINKQPLVSIITIVYNASPTLERTIKSIQEQSYTNIEHIIIDGGSTDDSLNIIKKYEKKIEYFISEPDDGLYQAMNKGIRLAKGDYICMLNADDYYKSNFVEESIDKALDSQADIVYSAIYWSGRERFPVEINSGILIHHLNINHMTFLVHKDIYNSIGLYNEANKLFSDDEWTRAAFLNNANFVYLPKLMVYFSEGGLSQGNSIKKRNAILNESGLLMRKNFPFLTQEEAEDLMMSRFRIESIDFLKNIYLKYASNKLFAESFKNYLTFVIAHRESFIFKGENTSKLLPKYIELAISLEIPLDSFQVDYSKIDIKKIFNSINEIANLKNKESTHTLLHFATQFSTPSETFIYDLLLRLESKTKYDNIFLCDSRLLKDERPYAKCIVIPYDNIPITLRVLLYTYISIKLSPSIIIGHFALNGWKVYQRFNAMSIHFPIIHMTHGIDVFQISTKNNYKNYILSNASINPSTAFTTVSNYLLKELEKQGVPSSKISLVPNVIHSRFFKYRKTNNFYDDSRTLKILSIGRLVEWKGHIELIEGLHYALKKISNGIELTIVYGKTDENLKKIQNKCSSLGICQYITFIDFIDFNNKPDYYSDFDLFISSSKYSDDNYRRSETFGLSTLEAIAAGLPVIVTDAGGSPEVVGKDGIYSKIVAHGNGIAIGKAIEKFCEKKTCFTNNIEYAKERLKIFSEESQVKQLSNIIEKTLSEKITSGIFTSMVQGGAGMAARRVHMSLLINNANSNLFTRNFNEIKNELPGYTVLPPDIFTTWESLQSRKYFNHGFTMFSLNEPGLHRHHLKQLVEKLDIINLHWTARFLSAEDIGFLSNLNKPLVITVRDMHPLTGGCHFFHTCDKWKYDCYSCPQLLKDNNHFPSKILAIKKRYWNMKNITFIALSNHSKNIIRQSAIYDNNRIEIIGNPIELNVFKPTSQKIARKYYNLDNNSFILFYVPSYGSMIKGSYELKESLAYIKKTYPNFSLTLLIAGSATDLVNKDEFLFPVVNLGVIHDSNLLAIAYSSANATIIPSLEETFSNTAAESISCGTPIVGFKTGAIPEFSGNGSRGISVEVGNITLLGDAIYNIMKIGDKSTACRKYAENNFSFTKQGAKYLKLFNDLLNKPLDNSNKNISIPLLDESILYDTCNYINKQDSKSSKNSLAPDRTAQKKSTDVINAFSSLCNVDFKKSPIKKINSYNILIYTWHNSKREASNKLFNQIFEEEFNNLCSVSILKNPILKYKFYKKLIQTWQTNKTKF